MAYDEDLANRIRELVATETGVTEKRMFGGLAFLIDGNRSAHAGRSAIGPERGRTCAAPFRTVHARSGLVGVCLRWPVVVDRASPFEVLEQDSLDVEDQLDLVAHDQAATG
jgi:hypothetical protein